MRKNGGDAIVEFADFYREMSAREVLRLRGISDQVLAEMDDITCEDALRTMDELDEAEGVAHEPR